MPQSAGASMRARSPRLAQLTDLHLSQDPADLYRGYSAENGLARVLADVKDWEADALVLSGDLSEDASAASYLRLNQALAKTGLPCLCLAGNHDDLSQMHATLTAPNIRIDQALELGRWHIHALASARPGRIDGEAGHKQLRDLITQTPADRLHLVFTHHHPRAVGSCWIDRFPLQDGEAVLAALSQHATVKALAFGHVHQSWERRLPGGLRLLATSATSSQSKPHCDTFTDDGMGPAWRQFYLDRTRFRSRVRRLGRLSK